MKLYITPQQLGELTDAQKQVLKDWWKPSVGDWIYTTAWADSETKNDLVLCMSSPAGMMWSFLLREAMPLPSIGQMIEFLQESRHYIENTYIDGVLLHDYKNTIGGSACDSFGIGWDNELCDALWEAVKEELKKTNQEGLTHEKMCKMQNKISR